MEEECDFDTLSAMIESDGEFKGQSSGHESRARDDADSSDEDIPEDDLDKLACLVEEEVSEDHSIRRNCGEAKDQDTNIGSQNKDIESPCEDHLNTEFKNVGKLDEPKEVQEACEEEASDDEDLATQLRLMKEQMQLLESKLKKKKMMQLKSV